MPSIYKLPPELIKQITLFLKPSKTDGTNESNSAINFSVSSAVIFLAVTNIDIKKPNQFALICSLYFSLQQLCQITRRMLHLFIDRKQTPINVTDLIINYHPALNLNNNEDKKTKKVQISVSKPRMHTEKINDWIQTSTILSDDVNIFQASKNMLAILLFFIPSTYGVFSGLNRGTLSFLQLPAYGILGFYFSLTTYSTVISEIPFLKNLFSKTPDLRKILRAIEEQQSHLSQSLTTLFRETHVLPDTQTAEQQNENNVSKNR